MKKEPDNRSVIFVVLLLITLLEIGLAGGTKTINLFWSVKLALCAVIGIGAAMLVSETIQKSGRTKKSGAKRESGWLIAAGYLVSLFWVLFSVAGEVYEFWMFGTLWIAFLVVPYTGMAYHVVFAWLFCMLQQRGVEEFVLYVLLGWIACGLICYMRDKKTILLSFFILACAHVIVLCLIHDFQFDTYTGYDIIYCILTFFAQFVIVMGLAFLQRKKDGSNQSGVRGRTEKRSRDARYRMLMNTNFPLARKIQERSKFLYQHSLRVAAVSGEVAKAIGADEKVAQTGGMYHDIGKLKEGSYIENVRELAKEFALPEEVTAIIETHNVKYGVPQSVEAAIVMLADSVISSMEVLQVKHGDLSKTKYAIVQKVFDARFENGVLDQSGLTFEQYRMLKQYFIEHDL